MRVSSTSTRPTGRRTRVTFFVDGELVKLVEQSPDYPMQLMLSIYEFPAERSDDSVASYPKAFTVDYVRGYRL